MQRRRMFKQGMSVLILAVFVLLALGSGSQEPAAKKETRTDELMQAYFAQETAEKKRQEREAAAEQARGYIEVVSDVVGTVLLNGIDTTRTIALGDTVTFTIENANGKYEISVRDSSEKIWQANKIISFTGGSREIAIIEDPKYVTSPNDFEFIQNTSGGLTITGYKGNHRRLVIPETISGVRVTAIGYEAFKRADHIYGDEYSTIGQILVSLVIPNSVTSIGNRAFVGNKGLGSLIIPDSVTNIGKGAFEYCGLSSLVLGNRVTNIGEEAFLLNALTTITIPNSVTFIGEGAFARNELTTITIPNNVTFIGWYAFCNNPITTIVIPPSLASRRRDVGYFTGAFFNRRLFATKDGGFAYDSNEGTVCNATSITLPANVDNDNLRYNFDQGFINYYISQNKKAGTYTKEDGIWKLTTPQ